MLLFRLTVAALALALAFTAFGAAPEAALAQVWEAPPAVFSDSGLPAVFCRRHPGKNPQEPSQLEIVNGSGLQRLYSFLPSTVENRLARLPAGTPITYSLSLVENRGWSQVPAGQVLGLTAFAQQGTAPARTVRSRHRHQVDRLRSRHMRPARRLPDPASAALCSPGQDGAENG